MQSFANKKTSAILGELRREKYKDYEKNEL